MHHFVSDGLVDIAIKSFSLYIYPQFGTYVLVAMALIAVYTEIELNWWTWFIHI